MGSVEADVVSYRPGDTVEVNITNIHYGPGPFVTTVNLGVIPPEWAPAVIERVEDPTADAANARYSIRVTSGFRAGTVSVVDTSTIRRPPLAGE